MFVLKDSVAPNQLFPGLDMEEDHIIVNRKMETNIKGLYAAGDCIGKPYQYIKAAGEGQADFLNKAKTDFNVLLGVCVGHDSLFIKYSNASITVFAVKDRVLAHNPLGALYLSDSYYKNKLYK